jgi:S-adenosylmethionine synthetase
MTSINEQSPDIALGVDRKGAGDQGMMIGYAIKETEELMPAPIMFAHKLVKKLAYVRKSGILSFLRPDGKSQVTMQYKNGRPYKITAVVISAQHNEDINSNTLREGIIEEVIKKVIPKDLLAEDVKYFINPTGRFVIGGPQADTGVTGRKIMVDTYGGLSKHGGGCFSGKDPTKVDRSASYMARYLAKNIVASGIAYQCEIQLAYVIGETQPVSIMVNTFNTSKVPDDKILQLIKEKFDLSPWGIIEYLDLRRPIYKKTAVYGHFGRNDKDFTWEKCDKKDLFKELKG